MALLALKMIVLKKKIESASYGGRSYIKHTYYFVNLEKVCRNDPTTYHAYRIQVYTDGTIHYDIHVWFPKYRLNMIVYQDASWLEMLVLFGLTKANINEKFRLLEEE